MIRGALAPGSAELKMPPPAATVASFAVIVLPRTVKEAVLLSVARFQMPAELELAMLFEIVLSSTTRVASPFAAAAEFPIPAALRPLLPVMTHLETVSDPWLRIPPPKPAKPFVIVRPEMAAVLPPLT